MNLRRFVLPLCLLLAFCAAAFSQADFYLKNGDRVVFYGDSITDQRLYTTFTETFVLTRFPKLDVNFVHSGWGGDRVTGGGGGPIGLRLKRDVFPYRPTVVTMMLGMNDGRYRPFDQQVFDVYAKGFTEIIKRLRTETPAVRITAIRPSPYDEVTREPIKGGGYNPVMVRFGDFVAELAQKEKFDLADLNAPVVRVLEKANSIDPALAQKIVPDRVHPGPGGHLIMAGALLKAWNAPALVSDVAISAKAGEVRFAGLERFEKLAGFGSGGPISWRQTDKCLPMPIDMEDPAVALAVKSSDFLASLNQETLKVTELDPGQWVLRIDGRQIAIFDEKQLAAGVNLALLPTPMALQAAAVHALTLKHNNIHFARWRAVQVPLQSDGFGKTQTALEALDSLEAEIVAKQRAAAQPVPHVYEIVRADSAALSVPQGFSPLFNGKDLSGWHISQVNHHGKTQGWKVENGVLTGSQDKPGHGGIILTDKKYKNFEITLELNPDFGCDSGLFLRANEKGEAYQVMLDYLEGGNMGGIYGERLKGVDGVRADFEPYWKKGQWNTLRARIEGTVPHIQVWMNGVKITDWTDNANHAADGAEDGMIALQVHGGGRWLKTGGFHRFRNVAIKELP